MKRAIKSSENYITIERDKVREDAIYDTEQVLIDNGIDKDDAPIVLQAIGYTLLDTELYPE